MNIRLIERIVFIAACVWFAPQLGVAAEPPPYLWRIEGKKPSYVFGTMHVSDPRVARLRPCMIKAIESCDAVLCEIPIDPEQMWRMDIKPFEKQPLLSEQYPPELYERAKTALKETGLRINWRFVEKMPAWEFAGLIGGLNETVRYAGRKKLDQMIYEWGQAAKKEVGGIEGVEEHMDVMNALTPEDKARDLREALDHYENRRKEKISELEELIAFYIAGDIDALHFHAEKDRPKMSPQFYDALMTKRNRLMAMRIHGKMLLAPDKGVFVAVGCAHLPGETGVLKLLEKLGHTLTRVEE